MINFTLHNWNSSSLHSSSWIFKNSFDLLNKFRLNRIFITSKINNILRVWNSKRLADVKVKGKPDRLQGVKAEQKTVCFGFNGCQKHFTTNFSISHFSFSLFPSPSQRATSQFILFPGVWLPSRLLLSRLRSIDWFRPSADLPLSRKTKPTHDNSLHK